MGEYVYPSYQIFFFSAFQVSGKEIFGYVWQSPEISRSYVGKKSWNQLLGDGYPWDRCPGKVDLN
jgi:hypothetical protein